MQTQQPGPTSVEFKNRQGLRVRCTAVDKCVAIRTFFPDDQTALKVLHNTVNKFMQNGWKLIMVDDKPVKMSRIIVPTIGRIAMPAQIKKEYKNVKLPKGGE